MTRPCPVYYHSFRLYGSTSGVSYFHSLAHDLGPVNPNGDRNSERSTHWNSFYEMERYGAKRVDILPLLSYGLNITTILLVQFSTICGNGPCIVHEIFSIDHNNIGLPSIFCFICLSFLLMTNIIHSVSYCPYHSRPAKSVSVSSERFLH